jgi:hypothetical protein
MELKNEDEIKHHLFYWAIYDDKTNEVLFTNSEPQPTSFTGDAIYHIFKHSALGGYTVSTVDASIALCFKHSAHIKPTQAVILFAATLGLYEVAKE